MQKHIVKSLFGLLLAGIGFLSGYIYIQDIRSASPFLLGIAVALFPLGIFTLYKAGNSEHHIPQFVEKKNENSVERKSLLQQHHELSSDYNKTSVTREKLRMVRRTNF